MVLLTLLDESILEMYLNNPRHMVLVKELIPYIKNRVSFDYVT